MTRRWTVCATLLLVTAAPGVQAADDAERNYFAGLEYRNLGPSRGGRVTAVSGVANDPLTYYMGSTGGGIWKTTNAGTDWFNVSDDFVKTGSVGSLDVCASDTNVVVAGMGESPFRGVASSHGDGVYVSTDAGETWVHRGLAEARQISSVKCHPHDSNTFWVAVQGSPWAPTRERGVYKTVDGGKTWRQVLFVDQNTGAVDLEIDLRNPRILYSAMWDHQRTPWEIRSGGPGSGLHKSVDGGETWKLIVKGLPDELGKMGIAPSPAHPGLVWAVVEAREKGGLYRSSNGGKTWKHVNGERRLQARSWYYMHIHAHPTDKHTVIVQNAPMLQSVDGGKTFQRIFGDHGDHHDLWINPDDPENMIDGNDGGAAVTFDGGRTWSTLHNQPTAQFYRVNADNAFDYKVYGGQQDNSTVAIASRGPDGAIGREDYHPVGGCECGHIAFDPDDPRLVYAGCYLGQISEFDVATGVERDVRAYPELLFGVPPRERKFRFNWNAPIVVSQHDPSVVYHAGNVVLKTTDRGVSWTPVSPDLTRDEDDKQGPMGRPITNEVSENYNTIMALSESPHDPQVLWVGTDDGLVHVTRDGGANWKPITPRGVGEALVNSIDVSVHTPGTAYVAITRYKFNDHTPMIYKTSDFGRSWRQIARGIDKGSFVRVVREDPTRQGLLFAGTETGVWVSWNDGAAWEPLQLELPHTPVTDIKVHQDDLVLSTQGRGFWILDGIGPIRQANAAVRGAAVHLFEPALAHMVRNVGSSNRGPAANPPSGAVIDYALAGELDLDEQSLTIEILDGDGRVVRKLTTDAKTGIEGGGGGSAYRLPAEKGINRIEWDYRHDPLPKVEGLFSMRGGGDGVDDGRLAAPGAYTVRLTLGDTVQEQPLTVALDPRVDATPAQVSEQSLMLGQVESMLETLLQSVVSLRSAREQAKARRTLAETTGGREELVEAAGSLIEAIDAWEETVVSPKREFFQDVLNWPDRLDAHLQGLLGTIEGTVPPLGEGMSLRYADLEREFSEAMQARDELVDGPLAAFNALFARTDETGIALLPFDPDALASTP